MSLKLINILRWFYNGVCTFSILMGNRTALKTLPEKVSLEGDWMNCGNDFKVAIMRFEEECHAKAKKEL